VASKTNIHVSRQGFHGIDYIKITIFGFALSALWSSLHTIILPLRLLDFVAESQKNTYLGLITFTGLLLAIIVQPIAGAISDRSGFSWGRRRPYILIGTILVVLLLPGIGFCGSYVAIFIIYCLVQISSNTAHGPYQAFIPDLVPDGRRGLASGVKTLLEILGGVALLYPVAFFMDRYSTGEGASWLWMALSALAIALLGVMIATVITVRERPGVSGSQLPLLSTLYKSFQIDIKANRNFVWFLVSRLFILMAFTTLQTFALYFLRDVVGVASPAAATAKFSIVAVAGMLAAYAFGLLCLFCCRFIVATENQGAASTKVNDSYQPRFHAQSSIASAIAKRAPVATVVDTPIVIGCTPRTTASHPQAPANATPI